MYKKNCILYYLFYRLERQRGEGQWEDSEEDGWTVA